MNRRWDVIIVGTRVAGAGTAMLLARAGLRVLCVDRSRYGSDTLSTHALMRGGVLQLHRWGLLADVVAAGTPPIRRTVFDYGDESVAVSIKPSGGVDALYAPRRTIVDALLVQAAERAGAVVEFAATVTGLHRDHSGQVAGVVIRGRGGAESIERAPLVIGADGRDSLVAGQVGASRMWTGRHRGAFLYAYWANFPTAGYEWAYRPGLTAGAIPTNAGLTCLFVAAPPSRLAEAVRTDTPSAVLHRWAGAAGFAPRIAAADRVDSVRYVRGLPASYLRQAHGPGWALVGDAGHWMDPMSTHGMTAALRDAGLLARAVLTSPTPGPDQQQALARYQSVRDRLSLAMMRPTEEIASFGWDQTRIRTLLRHLSSAMTEEVEALAALAPTP